jgi:hypothetical protein
VNSGNKAQRKERGRVIAEDNKVGSDDLEDESNYKFYSPSNRLLGLEVDPTISPISSGKALLGENRRLALPSQKASANGLEHSKANLSATSYNNQDDADKKIRINLDKKYAEDKFISDLIVQKPELQDFLVYLMIFQDLGRIKRQSSKEPIFVIQEDRVVFKLLDQFGYRIDRVRHRQFTTSPGRLNKGSSFRVDGIDMDNDWQFYEYDIKVESSFNFIGKYTIKGINLYTNKRKRTSILVADSQKGERYFTIIVKGEESVMRDCLKLDAEEQHQFKQLMASYKQNGYRRVIVGVRTLTGEELDSYRMCIEKVAKSKRDQLEEYEKLASIYEKNLKFAGCIGFKDTLREDVKPVIDHFRSSHIDISLLSGDTLDNCLHISSQLLYPDVDFNDASQHHSLICANETRLKIQIKRAIEDIQVSLNSRSIEEKFIFWNHQHHSKESREPAEQLLNITERRSNFVSSKSESADLQNKFEIEKKRKRSHRKVMLINGRTLDLLQAAKNDDLIKYFQVILIFTRGIIGYEMKAHHKCFIVEQMQKLNKVILAVGDGFNDIGILNLADASLQMTSRSVPFIIADTLVNSFRGVHHLYFRVAHTISRNIVLSILIYAWNISAIMGIQDGFGLSNAFSGPFLKPSTLMVLYGCMAIDSTIFILLNRSYSKGLVNCLPVVSREISIFRLKFLPYLISMIIAGIFEAAFIAIVSHYYIGNAILVPGYPVNREISSIFVDGCLFMNAKVKLLLLVSRYSPAMIAMQFLTIIVAGLYILLTKLADSGNIIEDFPVDLLFVDRMLIVITIFTILAWSLATLFFTQWIKYHLYYKYFDLSSVKEHASASTKIKAINKNFSSAIKYVYKLTTEELLMHVKRVTSKQMIEKTLSKLMYTDPTNQRLGIGWVFNQITDRTERKRFFKYYMRKSGAFLRGILSVSIFFIVGEYLCELLDKGTFNLQIHTGLPMQILFLLIPLVCSMMKNKQYFTYYSLLISMTLTVSLTLILVVINPEYMYPPRNTTMRRLVFSSIPLTLQSSIAIGVSLEALRLAR